MARAKRKAVKKPIGKPAEEVKIEFGQPVEAQSEKKVLRPAFEIGQEVMVKKPSKIHKNYHGAIGHVTSVEQIGSGYRVEVKLIAPDKQRFFGAGELIIHHD